MTLTRDECDSKWDLVLDENCPSQFEIPVGASTPLNAECYENRLACASLWVDVRARFCEVPVLIFPIPGHLLTKRRPSMVAS